MRRDRYVFTRCEDHPRARNGRLLEHIVVAETALGKRLPLKAQVHHVDGDGKNNHPSNLVVCEDQGYHNLLHRRMRGLEAFGNPDALPCNICGEFDLPENLRVFQHKWKRRSSASIRAYHRACKREQESRYRERLAQRRLCASCTPMN